jgi:DNA invertase Pin-like site-specific DNA recombinase
LSQKVEQSLFEATICFVGKLDRLDRDLRDLANTVQDLTARGIGFKVLTGYGASMTRLLQAVSWSSASLPPGRIRAGANHRADQSGHGRRPRPWPQWWEAL